MSLREPQSINDIRTAIRELSARAELARREGRTDDAGFQKRATQIGIVLIALYEIYWGLIYQGGEDIWDYLAVSGSIYFCSGIVLLAGGAYWPRATRLNNFFSACRMDSPPMAM